MQIRTDDRVFICAKTGAGKTTFVKRVLLAGYPRIVFWDIKKQNSDWPHNALCANPNMLKLAIQQGYTHILYQPIDIDESDFNEVCRVIYETGNIALYVDEVAFVTSQSKIERYHKLLLVMGRGRGCGLITGTQRPMNIPNFCISESEHFFIGRLQLKKDIEKLDLVLPEQYQNEVLRIDKYCWLYTDTETVTMIPPIAL